MNLIIPVPPLLSLSIRVPSSIHSHFSTTFIQYVFQNMKFIPTTITYPLCFPEPVSSPLVTSSELCYYFRFLSSLFLRWASRWPWDFYPFIHPVVSWFPHFLLFVPELVPLLSFCLSFLSRCLQSVFCLPLWLTYLLSRSTLSFFPLTFLSSFLSFSFLLPLLFSPIQLFHTFC